MTTTYDHETFYQNLKETILEAVKRKYTLFALLPEQSDIIQRKEALLDMLTIFSFQESVVVSSGLDTGSLDANIRQTISDYYRHVGDGEVVGVTPTERMMDELEDLAYIIQPKFPMEYFTSFMNEQGLDEHDQGEVAVASLSTCVIASILIVIKSEMMLIVFTELFSKLTARDKRLGVKNSGQG